MASPSTVRCFTANSVLFCSLSPSPTLMTSPPPLLLTDSAMLHLIFFVLSVLSLLLLFLSLIAWRRRRRLAKPPSDEEPELEHTIRADASSPSALKLCLSKITEKTHQASRQKDPTFLPQSFLVELLPSGSPKWSSLFPSTRSCGNLAVDGSDLGDSRGGRCGVGGGEKSEEEREGTKKKKKRGKKKKQQNLSNPGDLKADGGVEMAGEKEECSGLKNKEELVCFYPFTSSSSATQRKIKQHYDQLVKSHESKGLTLAQVGQFVNCLVDAQNELQQKSEIIHRKFTITKALLGRADRSSFDRLQQQLYKLESEQKRLEEDAFVYNWLQHQLKLSPAYKKIVEIGSSMEMNAKSSELMENPDTNAMDISFEELLAQEKKDSFWQKHGKRRLSSSS